MDKGDSCVYRMKDTWSQQQQTKMCPKYNKTLVTVFTDEFTCLPQFCINFYNPKFRLIMTGESNKNQ